PPLARQPPAPDRRRRGSGRLLERRKAQVVLVHEPLPVEPEVLRVRPQEPSRVRGRGQDVELLVLERAQVAGADPRVPLDLRQLELPARARLPQAAADLEHARLLTTLPTVS